MDDDGGEENDGWSDTVDDSFEKDMESVEWGWHSERGRWWEEIKYNFWPFQDFVFSAASIDFG